MSGFFCIHQANSRPVSSRWVERMVAAGRHRGHGGVGVLRDGRRAFAQFDRFSRPNAAAAPLVALGGALVLVCDARLDERDELRNRLALPTETSTDAQLILGAYRKWGLDCPQRLLGDFAFVLWDRDRKRYLCGRDCFGTKPLHYSWTNGTLCVASEAQQILQHPSVSRRLDEGALAHYLVDDESDESATFFRDVRRLPPGHILILEDGRLDLKASNALVLPKPLRYRRDEEYSEHFLEVLGHAVESRLETSGSRVGIFMSGGLDSSSVAALAQERLRDSGSGNLLAGTYAFPSLSECDESTWSESTARDLGIDLRPVNVEDHWLLGDPEIFAPDLETPFQSWRGADTAILEIFRDEGAEVFLTGLGGDNVTQGSHQVFRSLLGRGRVLDAFRGLASHGRRQGISAARAAMHYLVAPSLPKTLHRTLRRIRGRASSTKVPPWIHPEWARRNGIREDSRYQAREKVSKDPAVQVGFSQLATLRSVARSCYWLDRLGARFSMEARHPFLDRRVADFVLSIPPELIFDGRERKMLLRKAMAGRLPENVRRRRGKTRFGPFIHRSLQVEAASVVRNLLSESSQLVELGLVEGSVLAQGLEAYFRGEDLHGIGEHLWYLVTLEIWLKSHFGGEVSNLEADSCAVFPDPAFRQARLAI